MAVEENLFPRAIVLHNEKWHEGVLGIVASKVVEKYKRPVFVLSKKEDTKESIFKGSIRSYAKVDIIQNISVESVSRHLLNYGGHAHAGGVTLLESELESFKMTINIHLALSTTKEDYIKTNPADVDVELSEIDGKLANELEQLAPFGIGFTEPMLRVKAAQAKTVKIMKEKHLKITFTPPTSTFATTTDALWFNVTKAKEKAEKIKQGLSSNFHVTTQWNEWNGNKKLQLMIQEMNLD
jgi:single-stranded-DNA-specific exonuclease